MRYAGVQTNFSLKLQIMKRFNLTTALLALISFGLLISSCKKDTVETSDTSFSSDNAFAESVFTNVSSIADEAYELSSGSLKSGGFGNIYLGDCATLTLDTTSYPYELIIDFGEVNCLGNDGRYRRGKIIVTFTGRYRSPGTVITYGFDDYYVNDNKVDGTKVVTNMGPNDAGNLYYRIEVTAVIHKANEGGTVSWNSTRQREWVEGSDTYEMRDDVYLITGIASGIRPNGSTWEAEIVNALRVELNCRWIVKGTINIQPEGRPLRILDYGDGECDNIATVLINGVTYTIYLH